MKRFIGIAVALLLCVTLFGVTVSAAAASATLEGPGTVRAGDTITLTFYLNGSGIYGASGTLSYNANQLTMTGTSQKIAGGWKVEFNGNNFLAIDENLEKPINSKTALFTVTFKVNSSVTTGTAINVSYTNVTTTDGNADTNVNAATYSVTVAAPKSTDNSLKSLTVSNATISPAFSTNTTSYTAEVPFSVSKLNVTAAANDSKAKVTVNSPNLVPGGTTNVTVTVTAESGSTKTYTIKVTRAQDPNYTASSNNDLSGISVDGFLLSPVFSADNTSYVIWLPYETDRVTVSGTASDSKASVRVEGGDNLIAGADNQIKVICVAEDGTEKVYTVIAKRAAAHDGSTEPEPTDPPATEPSATEPSATEPAATEPAGTDNPSQPSGGVQIWVVIVASAVCLAAGLGVGILIGKKK